MTIKLIMTDMDETFLKADKTYDVEKAEQVVKELSQKGIKFGIASGNSIPLIKSYFSEEFIDQIYLAGDDGNVLMHKEKLLREQPMVEEDVLKVVNYINDLDGYYLVLSAGDQAYVIAPISKEAEREFNHYYAGFKLIDTVEEIPSHEQIYKMEMYCEHPLSEIKKTMDTFNETLEHSESVTSGEEWLDVYHIAGGKGEAVKYLQEQHGISPEETMCFGDSLNDIGMMQRAKYSIAMSNADEEMKKYCSYEIGTNEDQEVLATIEKYLEQQSLQFLTSLSHE